MAVQSLDADCMTQEQFGMITPHWFSQTLQRLCVCFTSFHRLFTSCVFVSLVFTDSSPAVCLFHWFSQTVNKLCVCFTGFHRLLTSCMFVSLVFTDCSQAVCLFQSHGS